MKTRRFFQVIIAAAVVSGATLTATAQQQTSQTAASQKQEAKPAPAKTAKVWSDDDLSSLRSPSDNYQIEQAKEKEAQKAAAQQAPTQAAVVDGSKPKTVQQADGMIADKQRTFASEQEYLQQVKKQANDPSVSGLEKKRLEWRLESHTATAQHLASEIKQLQADRDALAKKPSAGSDAPAAPPQSQ